MKKKQYCMGRKHMQFYITFDEKECQYVIKPIKTNDPQEILEIFVKEQSLFSGTYAECHAFQRGYQTGYSIMKTYLKQNLDNAVTSAIKVVSKKVFDNDVSMKEEEIKENERRCNKYQRRI